MIAVSNTFKTAMKQPIKELDAYIKIDENTKITSADDLISIKISCEASLCKTAMRKLEARYLDEHNLLGKWVHVGFGVRIPDGTFEYLDYGSFLISEITYNKDTGTTQVVGYDKMVNAMTKYEKLDVTYPIDLYTYTQMLCTKCGLMLGTQKGTTNEMFNWQVTSELWENINGITYRDILVQIAQATGTTCIISNDDKLYLKPLTDTNEELTYDNMFRLKLEPIYGEINSVILGRDPVVGEDVFLKDETSITTNGLTEFRIDNNEIVDKNREEAISPIYDLLHGISYYPFETTTEGLGWYEIADNFDIVNDNGDTFNTTLFNFSITIDGGIKEILKTVAETKTQTQYQYASPVVKRIRNTEIIVDKQNQRISAIVQEVNDATEKVDKVYGQVETSIKDIKPYYAVSTSDTTPPTTGWTDQVPVRQPNEYLWRRDLITYQSGTTEYTVPYMATGDKGDTGTGVQSITTQFYLSNSKETQTGGSWVETMPSWTNGKYLWTRNKIVYKNPTSTVYTEPVCDSSYDAVNEATQEFNTKFEMTSQQINSVVNSISEQESAINNITQTINETTNQISETGGSNLLLNTRFYQNADEWEKSENASFEVLLDNQDFISKTESKTAIKMKNGSISQQFSTIIGQQYTLSFKYKKAGINIRNSQIYIMIGSKKIDIFSTTSQVNNITDFSYTYSATTTSPVIYIETDNDDFYVSDLIVQTGTSKIWTPNPSETRGLGHKLTRDELELYDIASSGESVKMTPNSLRYYQNNNQVTEYSKNRMNTPYAEIEQGKIGNITITKVGNDITLFS